MLNVLDGTEVKVVYVPKVSSLVTDKISLEKETKVLDEKIHALERKNSRLMEENSGLHSDINSLIQVLYLCTHTRTHTLSSSVGVNTILHYS